MAVRVTVSGAAFFNHSMPALPRVPTPIQPMLISVVRAMPRDHSRSGEHRGSSRRFQENPAIHCVLERRSIISNWCVYKL